MLNELYPQRWKIQPLKVLVSNFLNGGTPRTENSNYWDGSIPWITGVDAEERITSTARKNITQLGVKQSATNIVPKNNILLVTRTGVGKVSIAGVDVAISQDLTGLIINLEVVNPQYLYRQLLHNGRKLQRLSQGSIIQGVERKEVEELKLPVPCLAEQEKIAQILDTIDNLITLTDCYIAKLKQAKAGLLHDLLICGIDENGELRDPIKHPQQFKEAGTAIDWIPRNWEVMQLSSVCERITDGSHQSVTTSENGVPFLYVSCVRDGRILWNQAARVSNRIYQQLARGREVKPGLILYTVVGSYGHAALVTDDRKFSFQRHIAYILPNPNKILPGYLCLWLNCSQCKTYANCVALGNAQKTVTLGALNSFPVPLPNTLEEQRRVLERLDIHNKWIEKKELRLEKLKLLKKGLMTDLLTGRVRVNLDVLREG